MPSLTPRWPRKERLETDVPGREADLRILIVDDNPVDALAAARVARSLGHATEVARDGHAALERIAAERFELVLMDVQMPVIDGFEATRRVRERERETGGHVTILALTTATRPSDADACRAAGMDGHLAKPLSVETLRLALARRPGPPATPEAATPPAIVLDFERLEAQLGGEPEAVHEVLVAFLREGPAALEKIRAAVGSTDSACLERAAHSLKGALLWIAAPRASASVAALESIARSGGLAGAAAALQDVEREVECVLGEIRERLSDGTGV